MPISDAIRASAPWEYKANEPARGGSDERQSGRHAFLKAAHRRFQVVCRADRIRLRTRADRRRWSERLRQVRTLSKRCAGSWARTPTRTCARPAWTTLSSPVAATGPPAMSRKLRSSSTIPPEQRQPPSTMPKSSKSRERSSERKARHTASITRRCAPATSRSCSRTPRPDHARRSMVRQGMIGEIISAKPQARRRILEEAAGVAGLHSRRHEAELRLKHADDNLTRLEDVLKQIESQIESLKRQARQANRYKALSADIRRLEALAALIRAPRRCAIGGRRRACVRGGRPRRRGAHDGTGRSRAKPGGHSA